MEPRLDDEKARELFLQGRSAYDRGEYRDAWDHFHQAYMLSKRPQLLYNVGQAADRLRQDREAVSAFRLYLKKLPNAENRVEVENRLRALEQRVREEEARRALEGEEGKQPGSQGRDVDFFDEDDASIAPPGAQPTRQGWYLRAALGIGVLRDGISNIDQTLSGATGAGLVTVGYGIEDELVVGGGVFFDWVLAPKAGGNDVDTANLTLIGPFGDYYFDPHGDGWHVLGALGIGTLALSDRSATVGLEDAGGAALIVGGGYEWPYDRAWAMGVLGRLVLGRLSQDLGDHTIISPSIAFTAAWY
jgi:hypothetical protein